MEGAPEPLDRAFDLGRVGQDQADAQLIERCAHLGAWLLPSKLLLDGLVVGSVDREDAVTVCVEGEGHALALDDALSLGQQLREVGMARTVVRSTCAWARPARAGPR